MAEDYKPSKKEVFSELGSQIKSGSKKALNCTLNYIKEAKNCFMHLQKPVYALPTFIRKKGWDTSEIPANKLGIGIGAIFTIGQLGFYIENATDNILPDNELYLIPLATNVASGLYEGVRAIYKNTEKKLMEKHNKGLEAEVKQ